MNKQTLNYFVREGEVYTGGQTQTITKALIDAGLINFLPDSEIFEIHARILGPSSYSLSACVVPINQEGNFDPVIAYMSHCKKEDFRERTRDLYFKLMEQEGDIFPITPSKVIDLNNPEILLSKSQHTDISFLLSTYLEANPNPHPRLAIVSADRILLKPTLEAFLSISKDLSELSEIQLTEQVVA